MEASERFTLPNGGDIGRRVADCLDLSRANCRKVSSNGFDLDLYSYFPSRDHLIDKSSLAYRYFLTLDAAVPDNDSTSIVFSAFLRLRGQLGGLEGRGSDSDSNIHAFLALLEAHVNGDGRFGQGSPSYENGVDRRDHGILTWLFDHHNELDPTSNVNVLSFLATLSVARQGPDGSIAGLARRILGFLDRHAGQGGFLTGRIQQYYPAGSVYFFWYRMESAMMRLQPEIRASLDPEGVVERIGGIMLRSAPDLFFDAALANQNDFLLASPFLARHGLLDPDRKAQFKEVQPWIDHISMHQYETFHLLYPVKMLCVAKNLPLAAYLYSIVELDARGDGGKSSQRPS